MINAHNGKKGIDNEIPGSIILEKSGREISMSIDYDLDGSIDVNHKIIFKKNKWYYFIVLGMIKQNG